MADMQDFPTMWEDFVKTYEFRDKEELYTNGAMLVPSFRVEQMVKHYFAEPMSRPNVVRCRDCKRMRDWTADELADSYDKEELADGWCEFFRIGTYNDFFCAWGENAWVTCKCGEDIERHDRIQTCPSCGRRLMA